MIGDMDGKDLAEEAILEIRERNARVENDKAWETSWTRRLYIAAITFACALAWLMAIGEASPWLKACIPVMGYLLSTLSLPVLKRRWLRAR
jgi:hypothetical protein